MAIESVRKIIVEIDVVTGEQNIRDATDEEMAAWPAPFASHKPEETPTE
jgi:hypothetical protein